MPPPIAISTREAGSRCIGPIDRHQRIGIREFFHEYFEPRKPVILGHLTDGWTARKKWDFDFFREHYGDVMVTCGRHFDKSVRQPMRDYIDYVEAYEGGQIQEPQYRSPLYVEGWYFRRSHPELARDYDVPAVFANDWWNKFIPDRWDPKATAILIGPKGTFTKLHYDLMRTHSWNTQVRGSKRWLLVSPDQANHVYPETRQGRGYFPGTDIDNPDIETYPKLREVRWIEGVVAEGETIFFPRGWWHQVTSLSKSISLTHNYMSGNNCLAVMSAYVQKRLGQRNI